MKVMVCEICGYQWDANNDVVLHFGDRAVIVSESVECPTCESQMVHEMRKKDDPSPDGKPWH